MSLFKLENVQDLKAKKDVEGLLEALTHHGELDICDATLEALVELGDPRSIRPMFTILDTDEDFRIYLRVKNALSKIGADNVNQVIEMLGNESDKIRKTTMDILGKIGDESAVKSIIPLLKDDVWEIRECAVSALGEIGGNCAIDALMTVLGNKNSNIRIPVIIKALGETNNPRVVMPLSNLLIKQTGDIRYEAARALIKLYTSNSLDDLSKQSILAMRGRIENSGKPHSDFFGPNCVQKHTDESAVKVEFPL